ncbi:MAG: T9SS type A sorting domain-containing protein, partial [Bacteroidales bacterium]
TTTLSTIGVYYNSIYLDATSSGTNFGTSGIYHTYSTTATTATLDMRNNIIVNNSIPNGTGKTVAFRRSASTNLNNFGSTSNNNLFYAGTPGSSRLLFYDGTNSDQAISTYKTRVSPMESNSFSELPPFINTLSIPYNLHLNTTTPTYCESGGLPVATPSITTDYDGETRNASTSDIGADEGGFTMMSGVWTGAISTDWSIAGNWSNLSVPDNTVNVVISSAAINQPHITLPASNPAVCLDLTINSGAVLTVDPAKALSVGGTITNNSGTTALVLKSDATGTASLIHNTAAVSATVERYITQWTTNTDGWRLVSSPIGTTAVGNFAPGTNDDFYRYDEIAHEWKNYKVSTFDFTNGEGYLAAYETTATKSFAGPLNTTAVSFNNLSKTTAQGEGWHLLGNPFASPIKWNDGTNWNLSNVNGLAKIWNGGSTYSDIASDEILPAMQGFMIQVSDVTNAITISPASRVHSVSNILNKTANNEKLFVKVESIGNNTYTENIIKFNDNATNNFDLNFDSHFLEGMYGTPKLYSQMGNDKLSTNSIPSFAGNFVIPMGFVAGLASNYSLSFTGVNSFINCSSIMLEDTKNNIFQDLMQNQMYNFTALTSDNTVRFRLHFNSTLSANEINGNSTTIYAFDNTICIKSNEKIKQIAVYNILGQLVKSIKPQNDFVLFSLNGISANYYIVRVITDKNVYSVKVKID